MPWRVSRTLRELPLRRRRWLRVKRVSHLHHHDRDVVAGGLAAAETQDLLVQRLDDLGGWLVAIGTDRL